MKHQEGKDARTGVPLVDGLCDINHKDSDNSNIMVGNCEILDPNVHAHITRNTTSKETINSDPEKYIEDEIYRHWAASCLTYSLRKKIINNLIDGLPDSDKIMALERLN